METCLKTVKRKEREDRTFFKRWFLGDKLGGWSRKAAHESVFSGFVSVGDWWASNNNALHPFLDFRPPLPRRKQDPPHCPPHGVETKNLAGSLHGGTLLSANLYRIQPGDRYVESFFSGRGRARRVSRNRFLLRPLIRRGPVPSCQSVSWFRSIEHANAPQFVPDVRWLHWIDLYIFLSRFYYVYIDLFKNN